MKKILLTLPLAIFISACVSTTKDSEPVAQKPNTANTNWTASLSSQKMVLRSCIIADKSIQAILNIEQQAKSTTLMVQTNNGAILNCVVDTKSNKIIKMEPANKDSIASTRFYPVGKKSPSTCSNKENIMDAEGRLMGVVCR